MSSESALIERAKAGDHRAMEGLYRAHAARVFSVVRRIIGDPDLAQDLSQETWLRAFRKLHLFRGEATFATWVHRVATNVALGHLQQRKRKPRLEPLDATADPAVQSDAEAILDHQVLQAALDRLPDGYREVLVLFEVEGLPHEEIAERLGISVGTSRSQLFKARARMRQLLAGRI